MHWNYLTLSISCFSLPKKRFPEEVVESVVDEVEVVVVDVLVVVVVNDVVGVTDVLVDVTVVVLGVLNDDARLVASCARSKLVQSTPTSFPSDAMLLYGLTLLR